jgi:hypothetical protein
VSYTRNLLSMTTRFLNAVFGGNRRGESMSSAVGRKALKGRRFYIITEAVINLAFAITVGQRDHCGQQYGKEKP